MAYSVYTYGSQYAETGQVGIYVGTREDNLAECLAVTAEELADVGAGNLRPGELERAKENLKGRLLLSLESTSNRMTRLGKALITDTELVSAEETIASRDGGHGGGGDRGRPSPVRAGPAVGCRDRAAGESLPGRRRAGEPGARGPSVKVCLFGAAGKVGGVVGPALERAGHEVVDGRSAGPDGCDAAVDFTRPDAVLGNVERCLARPRSRRDRDHGIRPRGARSRGTRGGGARASTPRTSPSARS